MRRSASLLALAIAIVPSPLLAQATVTDTSSEAAGSSEISATAADPMPGSAADSHAAHEEGEIVVTGVRRKENDVLGGVSVLDEADLIREVRPSIGETLAKQPGVSATSFGPTASAPVLRGLSGDRVRVLTDGIGTLDLSSSGPDHAIAINPITAERIEVLRGPSALLFGSSAIGGVVNVIDTRIPRHEPAGPVKGDALLSYGSAANERSINAAVDVPVADHIIVHADSNWSKSDDLETGGHILSKDLLELALASPDAGIRALADLDGELPNSAATSKEGALGIGYVDGDLNVGVSVTRHLAKYQVPIRYSLDPLVEPEAPTIDVEQTRYDARAEIPVGGFLDSIRARGGYGNYHHDELDDTGAISSSFFSKGGEGRIELVQREKSGWGGTSGVQYLNRNAKIRGDEKFLPDSRQKQTGLFTLQTYVAGPLRIEGGARVEFSQLDADADAQLGTPQRSQSFTTWSGSLGGQYEFVPGWRAGLSLSHSERAPAIDELFANGPHGGSQAFEVGNPDLSPEKSNSVELGLHHSKGRLHLTANLFYSRFSNFIFQAPTGDTEDDLPVLEYRQGKATYYGFEAQTAAKLGEALGIKWGAELQGDMVHATVKNFGPAPLIPPMRVMGAITGEKGQFDGRIEIEKAFDHGRTAPNETDTNGYTLVNASIDWHPFAAKPALTLSLAGNNLSDVEARRSTSLLKDFAPLGGRDIRLTARVGF
ncbi:TonB-dependent receptor [Sphingomonas sp.]|uniref:TonB-dependent receptor n=1 Tax=Sphingomonas sp. TaxID=28214 RepID=UPI0025D99DEC|nr:TonB-dependent receptor [Sphingomonas sp.]